MTALQVVSLMLTLAYQRQFHCDLVQAQHFIKRFIDIYTAHGGRVENKNPAIQNSIDDEGKAVEATWLMAGNQCMSLSSINTS